MSKRILGLAAIATVGVLAGSPASAANNVMQACGAKYQAAKAAKTLPAGQTWNQYLAQCRGSQAPAAAATPTAAKVPASSRTPSAAMTAMHDRQRQCGTQWKADKAAGKVPAGQKWPQYWSACNSRLKG